MNWKMILRTGAIGLITLGIGLGLGRCMAPQEHDHSHSAASANAAAAPEKETIWTCSMHPQIRQNEPGDCPICGMDLIPLEEGNAGDPGPRAMSMSEAARALADIQTTPVRRDYPTVQVDLVGKLTYDETRMRSLTARFPARIEQLFVNYEGIPVEQGDHLAVVYSPELLAAQRELLTAHRADPDGVIAQAARDKLRRWDLLPGQIDAIIEKGEASDNFELAAPISGVVVRKNVKEGDYLTTGQSLFSIADLDQLWLMLDAYESDLAWLRYGQEVEFTVEAHPGKVFTGQITFIQPEVNQQTRTVAVRVEVPNADGRLKPGMFARGTVQAKVAPGGGVYAPDLAGKWISPMHPEIVKDHPGQCDICGMDLVPAESLGYVSKPEGEAPLVVPTSAVLRTGKRAVVYLERANTENPTYEGREIVLGPRAGDVFVVESGLAEGDRVVTNGAFKIDSALQIQAKPSMMQPSEDQAASGNAPQLAVDQAIALLPDYFALQQALAGDDFEAAQKALQHMMQTTGHEGPVPDLIHQMLAAKDLAGLREPHFITLSNSFIAAMRAQKGAVSGDLFLMHCPMAAGGEGADWLQPTDELRNPYYGAMMLTCGEVRANLSEPTEAE
ncbi:MAG: membrane-fusion protein [Puniceicoccaceae bacterium 5H]|nr:MAG: membrane-fusion protein [Puniceicoccaceae bacterium 5H]